MTTRHLEFIPDVHTTAAGTRYLKDPGLSLVAAPQFFPMEATHFVSSFDDVFDAADYEDDWFVANLTENGRGTIKRSVDDGAALCKFAGQTCYLSFGDKRSRNDQESVKRYFDNIKKSGHGSVLEHANYSMIVWGVDRAFSHELVRHRAGWAFSQMSQRYVSGKTLRFVERPEYQEDARLHASFEQWIDDAKEEYDMRAELLRQAMEDKLTHLDPTERRKAVNQAARNCLPNETETAIVLTGNVRAWRHVLEMRCSEHADRPIAKVMLRAYEILRTASPVLFDDYENDREHLRTQYKKV